ncbi:MAG: ChaN family lipoprotein [Phycisphaeraceae bacterium]|nr:MAG: ChaN family lipoprotein [Phycisphaeraceae bacterium]
MTTTRTVLRAVFWGLVAGAVAAGGCASSTTAGGGPPEIATIADPAPYMIVRGSDGSTVSRDTLAKACAEADAVLIGENHGHPLGLAVAADLWRDMLARSTHAALAMEFFERDQQTALDDYLAGITDEAAFQKASGRNPGNYPEGHRAMVEAAKAAGRPVVAANAPRRYVRLARLDGYDRLRGLTPEQSRLVRLPDAMPGGRYYDEFVKVMTAMKNDPATGEAVPGDPPGPEQLERINATFRSQATWDWTMAESVARTLDAGHRPVALVIGRFHVDHDGGTVQALRSLRPWTRVVVVTFVNRESATLRDIDRGRADFVIYVGPDPSEGKPVGR